MDLIVLVLVVAVVAAIVWWITTNLVTEPTLVKVIWFVTVLVLGFYILRRLGLAIPNVISG
jgi:hypothetical protein